MRKILFVTYQDFANVSSDIAHAINGHLPGWEAKVYSCLPHPFAYPNAHDFDFDFSNDEQKREAESWVSDGVDILVWAEESWPHSYYSFHDASKTFADAMLFGHRERLFATAKCFIFHAGVPFRSNPLVYNDLDPLSFKAQIVSPDLWRLSKDQEGIVCFGKPFSVDLERAQTLWETDRAGGTIVVCHSPTNLALKGTDIIDETMARIVEDNSDVEYRQIGGPAYQNQHIPYGELCEQRKGCHIYIDQYSDIGGVGMSSLEAMADGMIALCTSHMIPGPLWARSGMGSRANCPMIRLPCRTGDDVVDSAALYDVVQRLVRTSRYNLRMVGMGGALWVRQNLDTSRFAHRFIGMLDSEV